MLCVSSVTAATLVQFVLGNKTDPPVLFFYIQFHHPFSVLEKRRRNRNWGWDGPLGFTRLLFCWGLNRLFSGFCRVGIHLEHAMAVFCGLATTHIDCLTNILPFCC